MCLVGAALMIPPATRLLESSMTLHMLVHLPLLALAGFVLGRVWRDSRLERAVVMRTHLHPFNGGGATGLVLASFVMLWWMLPRGLDLAKTEWIWDAAKFASVTLAGLMVAMSWPRVPALARGVIHVEVIATFLRFGWGYLSSPNRLCVSYLQGDQERAGTLLLACGAVYALAVIWRPLFGTARPSLVQERD